ncbi:MAG: hypothetical protein JWM98_2907 [Thermoleophilia bacterium]|nr:hypothetical protein [Thermoleophilia bacterium]
MTLVPDIDALLAPVRADASLLDSNAHGENHWRAVARCAVEIRRTDPAPDGGVLFLFAVLHDARRESEHRDPEHGPRAARLAERLRAEGLFELDDARMALLVEACELHDTGVTSTDPTIGACYDADRLNLRRVGIEPDAAYLSRPVSSSTGFVDRCSAFDREAYTWDALLAELAGGD